MVKRVRRRECMYSIILVDDEPLILSGIKHLINWSEIDCTVIGTARNGKQAIMTIEEKHPDIVICDINMPVLTGLEVIKQAALLERPPVFIMLTNHQDFTMAQEALRYNVADYLLKNQLDEESLLNSLERAINKVNKQGKLNRQAMMDNYVQINKEEIVRDIVLKLLSSKDKVVTKEMLSILNEGDMLDRYAFINIYMDFFKMSLEEGLENEEQKELFYWQKELVEKFAENIFPQFIIQEVDHHHRGLVLFVSHVDEGALAEKISLFNKKIEGTSQKITRVSCDIFSTQVMSGEETLEEARAQWRVLKDYYFNFSVNTLIYKKEYEMEVAHDVFTKGFNKLAVAVRNRNIDNCITIFETILVQLCEYRFGQHTVKKEFAFIYTTIASILTSGENENSFDEYFQEMGAELEKIKGIYNKKQAEDWLNHFQNKIIKHLEHLNYSKSDLLDEAKAYVQENVHKKIMLQDVANHINISSSYLSSFFKKTYNKNFVDYINEVKVKHACDLIQSGKYKIYEISYMMGFENAYYFTKVFKKYIGVTPREYQTKTKK